MADMTTKTELRNDYTPGPFTSSFKRDNNLFYASFFHEARFGEEERIQFTGRILAVMLHPGLGTVVFYLHNDNGKWVADAPQPPIEEELLEWCGEQVLQHLS